MVARLDSDRASSIAPSAFVRAGSIRTIRRRMAPESSPGSGPRPPLTREAPPMNECRRATR